MEIVMGKFYSFRGICSLLPSLSSFNQSPTAPNDPSIWQTLLQMTENLNLINEVLVWPWDARLEHIPLVSPSWINSVAWNVPKCVVLWNTDFIWNDNIKSSVLHINKQKWSLISTSVGWFLQSKYCLKRTPWASFPETILFMLITCIHNLYSTGND